MTIANTDAEHVELLRLAAEYAPYHKFPLFWEGVEDYGTTWDRGYQNFEAQCWDRGLECASRFERNRRKS